MVGGVSSAMALGLHVAMLGLPFVVGLQQHGADQPDDRALVGKDADHIGTTLDLLVQLLDRVRRVDLHPVLRGKVHVRQHVGLALVDEHAELGPFVAQLIGDMTQRLSGIRVIGLDEGLAQSGRYHVLLALRHVGLGIAHPVHAATLPGAAQHTADRRLQPLMRVGDHQLRAA